MRFLRLLSRTITPNRTTHKRQVLRFQLCRPHSLKGDMSAFQHSDTLQ
jgi:hypothetical protein